LLLLLLLVVVALPVLIASMAAELVMLLVLVLVLHMLLLLLLLLLALLLQGHIRCNMARQEGLLILSGATHTRATGVSCRCCVLRLFTHGTVSGNRSRAIHLAAHSFT
jgi:hypothetical protein